MLSSLIPRLRCAVCHDPSAQLCVTACLGDEGHIDDGVLVCPACATWYPIEDGLLELVAPPLQDQAARGRFHERFAGELAAAGAVEIAGDAGAEGCEAQVKQRQHFDWFAADASTNYDAYQQSPFWRSVDAAAFARWTPRVRASDWLLDVGCANGRSVWPFIATGATIIGCDISKRLIAQAIAHARDKGVHGRTTFFVADADRLPLHDSTFDVVVTYGALHHLPVPSRTCQDIQRIARPGGVHFGSENNKSLMRPLFDLLMKVRLLWVEEAGTEPLISESMLRGWLHGFHASVSCRTHVFVPPHLVDLLGLSGGGALLRATDAIFEHVPIVRRNGGLLVFEIQKGGANDGV